MFEQSLYDTEPVAAPTSEGDLFHTYEIKTWEFGPRIYKILGMAAVGNMLALLVFAQTSLLTMKGCDSPLVGRVCEALDVVYVGAMIFGTDRDYVDAVYEKTELGDADITFVDVSGTAPPLSYPEGYFQIANPEEFAMIQQQANDPMFNNSGFPPGIPYTPPTTSGNSLLDTKPNIPKPNNDVFDGDLPTSFNNGATTASNDKPVTGRRNGRGKPPANDSESQPKPTPEGTPMSSDAVTAVEINKKPLTDFADDVATKWAAKQIDLNQDFTMVLNAVLTKDGKLDAAKSKFDKTKEKGDPKMIEVAKAALAAVGDSGYLSYLHSLSVDKLNVVVIQDNEKISVMITSPQKTAERASVVSSGLGGYILIGKATANNPSDERTLLDGAKATSDGKNFILNFEIPKPIAQEMITRKLKEAQAKKAQPQPNGNAIMKPNDNTAQK